MVKNILQTCRLFYRPVCTKKLTFKIIFLNYFFSTLLNSRYISSVDLGVAFGLEILHSGL